MYSTTYCPQCLGTAMTDHRDSVAEYISVRFIISRAILVLLCCCNGQVSAQDSRGQGDVIPYLIFATTLRIYRMKLDGSDREELVYEQNNGILGLEYHYRRNLLFWTNVIDPSIKQANLDGSNISRIVTNGPDDLELRYPADLALDWINDKLYWTDRDAKKIGVYDLVTAERRVILSTGSNSQPVGLVVYPLPDYGWLYWLDRENSTLEVAAVTGKGRRVLSDRFLHYHCLWSLTINYAKHTIYWINFCRSQMLSISMDGSRNTPSILESWRNSISYGIANINDTIFWTQQSVYFADSVREVPVSNLAITTTLSTEGGARGIEAVHPLQQPTAEVFREIVDTGTAECDPPCANGDCVDPGLCYCDCGWTGLDCLTDVNECAVSNGGCEHQCINLAGGYECSCDEGFTPTDNGESCIDVNECRVANGYCQHNCRNLEGGYDCFCMTGFSLTTNGRSCADVDECAVSNGGCKHQCINQVGRYKCLCDDGFDLSSDGRDCTGDSRAVFYHVLAVLVLVPSIAICATVAIVLYILYKHSRIRKKQKQIGGVIREDTGSNMEPEFETVNDNVLPNYGDLELVNGVHNPLHFQYLNQTTNTHSTQYDDATATSM